jgi:hypothetical protein
LNQDNQDREIIRHYLLGGVAEAELPGLEERILTDDTFYQELLIAEDELIDQYLLDTLSESDRSRFVSHFLITPERQDKLRFSKTLKRYLTEGEESDVAYNSAESASASGDSTRRRWFESFFPVSGRPTLSFGGIFGNRLILTAISLLILATISVVLLNRPSEHKAVAPEDLFVATLTPGLTRDSGETTRIRIPPDKKMVRLELQLESLPGSYQSYTAELRSAENSSTVLRRDNLLAEVRGNRQVVNLDVPVEDLKGGDYHVRLSGLPASGAPEPIGRYSFRIVD